jgi:hypothetical protein
LSALPVKPARYARRGINDAFTDGGHAGTFMNSRRVSSDARHRRFMMRTRCAYRRDRQPSHIVRFSLVFGRNCRPIGSHIDEWPKLAERNLQDKAVDSEISRCV